MKKLSKAISIFLCIAILLTVLPATLFAAAVKDFEDVKESDWFYEDVKYVVENGYFGGTNANTFAPKEGMTRAMVAAVLFRLAGSPKTELIKDFADVADNAYYAEAVAWAKGAGIVNGTAKDTFSPNVLVTREQFVSMLYRYFTEYKGIGATGGKELTDFADAKDVSGFALEAMKWALGNGIITGKGTAIDPKGTAQRCEVAAMVARFAKFLEKARKDGIRIVCMAPSMVECVYALGYGDCIVGWSAYTDYPVAATETEGYQPYQFYYNTNTNDFDADYELGKKAGADGEYKEVATVSKFYDYNATILEGLNPTLILCEGSEQQSWMEPTTEDWSTGSAVVVPNPAYLCDKYDAHCWTPESIDEIYDMMLEIGELLGCKDYAQELVDGYYARIDEISAISKDLTKINTYFEIAHQSDYGEWGKFGPYTEGAKTPFDEMIAIAGGKNIFDDGEGYINLYDVYGEDAFAEIVKRNPQIILSPYWPGAYDYEVTSLYEIMTRPGFSETQAVQTGRVCYYDSSLMKRFGPRTITAIEKLAYLLHPYYFDNPENSVSPWELGKIDVAEPAPAPLD